MKVVLSEDEVKQVLLQHVQGLGIKVNAVNLRVGYHDEAEVFFDQNLDAEEAAQKVAA